MPFSKTADSRDSAFSGAEAVKIKADKQWVMGNGDFPKAKANQIAELLS
jgi:hypothetical protein